GVGDGAARVFQLSKTYQDEAGAYQRPIRKIVAGSTLIAVSGAVLAADAFTIDETRGVVTFVAAPANHAIVSAGFAFDTPVRFDTDHLNLNADAAVAGKLPAIPLIELLL